MEKLCSLLIKILAMAIIVSLSGCLSKDEEVPDDTTGGGGNTTGGSVIFDGTSEYLNLSSAWYTGDFSICVWMKPNVIDAGGHTLLSMSAADKYFYLSFDANEVDFYWEDASDTDVVIDGASTIIAGSTYQVCITGDHAQTANNASVIYVNGVQIAGSGATDIAAVAGAFATLTIGYEPAPSFQAPSNKVGNFKGELDNVMIWSTALPANSIAQLYNTGSGLDPTFAIGNYLNAHRLALQHWFRMGDETGDTLASGSAVINDVKSNEDLLPLNFESTDFGVGFW